MTTHLKFTVTCPETMTLADMRHVEEHLREIAHLTSLDDIVLREMKITAVVAVEDVIDVQAVMPPTWALQAASANAVHTYSVLAAVALDRWWTDLRLTVDQLGAALTDSPTTFEVDPHTQVPHA